MQTTPTKADLEWRAQVRAAAKLNKQLASAPKKAKPPAKRLSKAEREAKVKAERGHLATLLWLKSETPDDLTLPLAIKRQARVVALLESGR